MFIAFSTSNKSKKKPTRRWTLRQIQHYVYISFSESKTCLKVLNTYCMITLADLLGHCSMLPLKFVSLGNISCYHVSPTVSCTGIHLCLKQAFVCRIQERPGTSFSTIYLITKQACNLLILDEIGKSIFSL